METAINVITDSRALETCPWCQKGKVEKVPAGQQYCDHCDHCAKRRANPYCSHCGYGYPFADDPLWIGGKGGPAWIVQIKKGEVVTKREATKACLIQALAQWMAPWWKMIEITGLEGSDVWASINSCEENNVLAWEERSKEEKEAALKTARDILDSFNLGLRSGGWR